MAPRLVFYLLKALTNLSLKIRILARLSYQRFPTIYPCRHILVLAWKV